MSTFSRENFWISDDLYLVILPKLFLGSRANKKNFANFSNFLAFFRVNDRKKNIQISICKLVVTQSMKGTKSSSQFRQKPAWKEVATILAKKNYIF